MGGRRRASALALLVLALTLAILAQLYFVRRPEYRWDGLLFAVLSALCLVASWRITQIAGPRPGPARFSPLVAWVRERSAPAGLVGIGAVLSLVAAWQARGRAWNQDTTGVVGVWLAGLAIVLAGAFWPPTGLAFVRRSPGQSFRALRLRCPRDPAGSARPPVSPDGNPERRWRRARWLEAGGVALLTMLALVLRVTALDRMPYTLAGDEAWFGLSARQVLQGVLRNPFVTGHLSMPTLFYWPMSWAMRLAGDNMVGARLPAAIVGTATIPLFYLFVRDLWGRRIAWLSAGFLAAYEVHVHYSRLALNNAWDPFFAVLAFWSLERGLASASERIRLRHFVITGLVLGLGLYFYTGARLLPLLVAASLLFFRQQSRSEDRAPGLAGPVALMGLACFAAAAPILGFALAHPDDWNARVNQVGILQSGWLDLTRQLTGRSTTYLLADQFLRAAGAFHVFPDRTDFYGIRRPLLSLIPAVLATLGMAWSVVHLRERRTLLLGVWFWAVIVTGGMLTESAPSSQRLILAVPAAAILIATGMERSVELGGKILGLGRRWVNLLLGLLLVALAAAGIRFYLAEYLPSGRYGSENGETATMIGHYAEELPAGWRAYFFGPPRLGWGFGSMGFLAPQVEAQDVLEPIDAPPEFADAGRGATFLFLPERLGELAWVQATFPAGRIREVYDSRGRLRFTAYEVPPVASGGGNTP